MLEITKDDKPLRGNLRHPKRDILQSMKRGAQCRCPKCGEGKIFNGYLSVADTCPSCGEELHHHRADDAPPYFTIFTVGHIVVPMIVALEMAHKPPIWLHAILWLPLVVILSLLLLPPIKGTLIGLQWALYMHGFDPDERDKPDPHIDNVIFEASARE